MLAVDLLSWAQTILLPDHPTLARAEPKTLRYRLLHVAARLVHSGRRHRLRLDRTWPWAAHLAGAFAAAQPYRNRPADPETPTLQPEQENPATPGRLTQHEQPQEPHQQDPQAVPNYARE